MTRGKIGRTTKIQYYQTIITGIPESKTARLKRITQNKKTTSVPYSPMTLPSLTDRDLPGNFEGNFEGPAEKDPVMKCQG